MGHLPPGQACANPHVTLAMTHKESTPLSISQVRILGFREIKEVAQGQTDK